MKVLFNKTPKTYFVISGGSNANNGTSIATPWATLTYALSIGSPVLPGDKIYVKAANYGSENVVAEKNGLPGSYIYIEGYKTIPGDAPKTLVNEVRAGNASPYAAYVVTEMPTYTGVSRNTGIAFELRNSQYLSFKNIQVQNYYVGAITGYTSSSNINKQTSIMFENFNVMSLGNLADSYSGFGLISGSLGIGAGPVYSNNDTLKNCLAVNCGAEGIEIHGSYNTLNNCRVYSNETANIMDYFITVFGSYNTLNLCYAEGSSAGDYGGAHGIGCKSNAEQVVDAGLPYAVMNPTFNGFFNCESVNIGEGFYVRHRGVQNNRFNNCRSSGTHTGLDGSSGTGGGIVIRDGASNNYFDSCYILNCESAIIFQDTTEDGGANPGNGNRITNTIFFNCYFGFDFKQYDTPSDAGANTVANCTFYKCRYLHGCYRSCTQMSYINNIYYGNTPVGGTFATGGFSANVVGGQFTNCNFYQIQGGLPGGFLAATPTSTAVDPLFVSIVTPDFHLQSGSPCRNTGATLSYVTNDYDGITRPFGAATSMGAFDR
jgi:hypothetical protein